jgi:hypothetical protein
MSAEPGLATVCCDDLRPLHTAPYLCTSPLHCISKPLRPDRAGTISSFRGRSNPFRNTSLCNKMYTSSSFQPNYPHQAFVPRTRLQNTDLSLVVERRTPCINDLGGAGLGCICTTCKFTRTVPMRYDTDKMSYLRLENSIICERQYLNYIASSSGESCARIQHTHSLYHHEPFQAANRPLDNMPCRRVLLSRSTRRRGTV